MCKMKWTKVAIRPLRARSVSPAKPVQRWFLPQRRFLSPLRISEEISWFDKYETFSLIICAGRVLGSVDRPKKTFFSIFPLPKWPSYATLLKNDAHKNSALKKAFLGPPNMQGVAPNTEFRCCLLPLLLFALCSGISVNSVHECFWIPFIFMYTVKQNTL